VAVKNPTQWTPQSGSGYVVTVGNENLVTNSGSFLVDNLGNFLITTPTNVVGKYSTAWTNTSKNDTNWVGSYVTVGAINNVVDQSGNFLVDQSLNFVVDAGVTVTPKNATTWTASGL
jgi:hypothetical protein